MWDLPTSVNIDGIEYLITDRCDYRVVLDVFEALNDDELTEQEKIETALYLFYEDLTGCKDLETAVKEMFKIINNGEEEEPSQRDAPALMDWKHDFMQIVPPVNRVLGYSVRDAEKHTHWQDLLAAYMEIGDCTFATIVSIRSKLAKGKKLEKHEQEFYNKNRNKINLPKKLTTEEQELLDAEW